LAQKTLEERIKDAQAAQAAREAAEKKPPPPAAPPPAPAGAPTITFGDPSARFINPAMTTVITASPEVIEIRGFLDDAAGLEAIVAIDDRRYSVNMNARQLPKGWEVVAIKPDSVEVARGSDRRVLRFIARGRGVADTGGNTR